MRDDEIDEDGYGSLPADERAVGIIASRVAAAISGDPVGCIPGFIRRANGAIGLNAMPGLLVPVRDIERRIVGVRVRVDDAAAVDGGKYRWLSGGEDKGGVSIDGHTVHVTLPSGPPRAANRVVIVEGEIKANIVARRLRLPVLSVPGVANINQVVVHLRLLGEGDNLEVAIAYDADKQTNPEVARHERRLVARVREAGYAVTEWSWSAADAKGLDDLLMEDILPSPSLYPEAAAPHVEPVASARVAELQEEVRLLSRLSGTKDLGGDVGNTVAVRITNYASHYAAQHNVPIGGVIPLVKTQVAKEFYDEERGEWHEAIAPKTIGTAVDRFVEHDIIETAPAVHTYVHEGVERHQQTTGLVWRGRLDLLRRFDRGSVYDEGEARRRGGKREKKTPIVCVVCGQTHAACTGCGTIFASVVVANGQARLDPDEPDADEAITHPRLLGEGGDEATTALRPFDNAPSGNVLSPESRRGCGETSEQDERRRAARADLARRTEASTATATATPTSVLLAPSGATPLFPLDAPSECEGCGQVIAGGRWCADCDPFTR